MRSVAALLAAALALAAGGCGGGGGAEPGAPVGATVVLDFQPNAVHAGIYAALREGFYSDAGVDLTVRQPSASTDAPKLLEAGRADFAILDIHDLAIARERGLKLVGVAPIVERPLAAVIARDRAEIRTPADLAGKTVGVTGLPSDDAVLDSVLQSASLEPDSVHRVTIGFNAVASLAAGRIDAATAFWNAEGVTLKRHGIPTREFRVDAFGAPRYPELVLTTTGRELSHDPAFVRRVVGATRKGYAVATREPGQALKDLVAANPELDEADQRLELDALNQARAFVPAARFTRGWFGPWAKWEVKHGIVARRPAIDDFQPICDYKSSGHSFSALKCRVARGFAAP
jgi:NitT/TauT family transport system substrate-binding protein/putative hydroxymethylpyrimidine transport system substrate-binding protein